MSKVEELLLSSMPPRSAGGIVHRPETEIEGGSGRIMDQERAYDLIVTIVNKGDSERVVEASRNQGGRGTILSGRGTGIHERAKLFGLTIEPEKELVLTLIDRELSVEVLAAIVDEIGLDQPGKGIAFVIKVERVAGISHLIGMIRGADDRKQRGKRKRIKAES